MLTGGKWLNDTHDTVKSLTYEMISDSAKCNAFLKFYVP